MDCLLSGGERIRPSFQIFHRKPSQSLVFRKSFPLLRYPLRKVWLERNRIGNNLSVVYYGREEDLFIADFELLYVRSQFFKRFACGKISLEYNFCNLSEI